MSLSAYAAVKNDFSSLQMRGVEQVSIEVDLDGAVKRLSRAVQFPTISNQDRSDFDAEAFRCYHQLLVDSYPNVHKALKSEVLGNPRPCSLLYTREGKHKSLPPALFYAHMDVVPMSEESRDQWRQDPFAGGLLTAISGGAECWMIKTRFTASWKPPK